MSKDLIRKSLGSRAYEQLRDDVLTCKLAPGERLNINELCQALGFNLSAVREALSKLTSEGLVQADPKRGFNVAPISVAELRDLTSVRIEIENLCLRRSIALGGVAWEASVLAAFHIMTNTPQTEADNEKQATSDWWTVHATYHHTLCSACDSPWLMRLRAQLFAQSERYRMLGGRLGLRDRRDVNREHQDITDAVLARDVDRATGLMASHFEMTSKMLLDASASDARDFNLDQGIFVNDTEITS
jgi:DNA-binding GntR family transcriptional regulator